MTQSLILVSILILRLYRLKRRNLANWFQIHERAAHVVVNEAALKGYDEPNAKALYHVMHY